MYELEILKDLVLDSSPMNWKSGCQHLVPNSPQLMKFCQMQAKARDCEGVCGQTMKTVTLTMVTVESLSRDL